MTYAPRTSRHSSIGNHETLNGLEQITSSRFISFIERAQMNDAFTNTRRLGVSAGLVNKAGDLRLQRRPVHRALDRLERSTMTAGSARARATYSPLMGGIQLHFGANFQYREFQSNNSRHVSSSVGAPSTNQIARYRARPFLQTTDVRFVDTGTFAAEGDDIFGLEFAGIWKSLHMAGELQYLKSTSLRSGDTPRAQPVRLQQHVGTLLPHPHR